MRYRFGEHVLDTDTLQLLAGHFEVELEPQVFGVLTHLVAHRDRVVSKEELLDEVWGSRFVSESALTTRIKQARQAVGDSGRDQRAIRTFHGRGYRFVADTVELDSVAPRGAGARSGRPRTRYAEGDGASIAYQTFGEGPDLALVSGFATNVEAQWEHPGMADFLSRLGQIARVTVFDKRGVGLSDHLPHDAVPSLETRADDLRTVLDATGVARAAVLGSSEGGSLSAVFAASHPERVHRLILHNTWVEGPGVANARDEDFVLRRWGSGRVYSILGPTLAEHPDGRELLARYERQSATPRTARHLLELIGEIDIQGILGAISVPTLVLHRSEDPIVPIAHGRRLASSIPGARFVALDGADHFLLSGDPAATLQAIATFLDAEPEAPGGGADADRILATVLFVDLVESTRHARALGDQRWTARLDRFHDRARAIVEAHRGRLVTTTGDGVLATFDGPGRGVLAAGELRDATRSLELTMRAGLHTAEIQRRGADIAGIGVQIAGRVAAAAHADEIWVSRTVTDLVAGTGLRFEPRGEHELRGLDEPWMLYAAAV